MKVKVLACETLRDEIESIIQKNKLDFEIIWLESGLHNTPKKLHKCIQEKLDSVTGCDRLLMALGRCGNSVLDLMTGDYETIMPKVEDCISLFFGSDKARNDYGREHAAIYMTEGWLRGESNIISEYNHMLEKYGEDTARDIIEMMYGHYRELALLDTGVYPIECLFEETEAVEKIIGLKRACVSAKIDYLEQLFLDPMDTEKFWIFPPHTKIVI